METQTNDIGNSQELNLIMQAVTINKLLRITLSAIKDKPREAGGLHRKAVVILKDVMPILHKNLRVAAIILEDRDGAPAQLETAKQAVQRIIDSVDAGTSSLERIKEEMILAQGAISKATGISVAVMWI